MKNKPDECQLDHQGKPLPVSDCPVCHAPLDAASGKPGQGDARPRPGDFSVCFRCGEVFVFQEDMKCRSADLNDLMSLDEKFREDLGKMQAFIRQYRAENNL